MTESTRIDAGANIAVNIASKEFFASKAVKFHAPLYPTTLRDPYSFEQNAITASQNRGRDVPEERCKFSMAAIFFSFRPICLIKT